MAEWTRDTPWRQGHLLSDDAAVSLGLVHPEAPDRTVVVIATHDCDLAQPIDSEPLVEVIVGRAIGNTEIDGNYTHAKNARRLHLQFHGDPLLIAEFAITAKHSIAKEELVAFEPPLKYQLPPSGRATFQRWLASRYHRAAFPDEFEHRLSETKLAERIAKAVKRHGEHITAVLFDVDDGEDRVRTGPDDVYILDITLLHAVEPDFDSAEAAASTAAEAIRSAFNAKLLDDKTGVWKCIELRYVDVVSEEALTYRQFTRMKRWRLDHVSLAGDTPQPLVPE